MIWVDRISSKNIFVKVAKTWQMCRVKHVARTALNQSTILMTLWRRYVALLQKTCKAEVRMKVMEWWQMFLYVGQDVGIGIESGMVQWRTLGLDDALVTTAAWRILGAIGWRRRLTWFKRAASWPGQRVKQMAVIWNSVSATSKMAVNDMQKTSAYDLAFAPTFQCEECNLQLFWWCADRWLHWFCTEPLNPCIMIFQEDKRLWLPKGNEEYGWDYSPMQRCRPDQQSGCE